MRNLQPGWILQYRLKPEEVRGLVASGQLSPVCLNVSGSHQRQPAPVHHPEKGAYGGPSLRPNTPLAGVSQSHLIMRLREVP